jgi:hypothetical protein
MTLDKRLELLKGLRTVIRKLTEDELESIGWRAASENRWFTVETVKKSLVGIVKMLDEEQLLAFANRYPACEVNKTVGLVLAGNIPAVGFHDIVIAFLCGCSVKVKLSHQDKVLITLLLDEMKALGGPEFVRVELTEKLELINLDAVIATGSNNSARYFEEYFSAVPNVIRKNRTSVGILNGEESTDDLENLAEDIVAYYGLGCRNVTKLMIPKGYDLIPLLARLEARTGLLDQTKYVHNYDYNKSILLVNCEDHLDTGNVLFKESEDLFSPISIVHYEYYKDQNDLRVKLDEKNEQVQCTVGSGYIPFGKSQSPGILDYADDVDTVEFLKAL